MSCNSSWHMKIFCYGLDFWRRKSLQTGWKASHLRQSVTSLGPSPWNSFYLESKIHSNLSLVSNQRWKYSWCLERNREEVVALFTLLVFRSNHIICYCFVCRHTIVFLKSKSDKNGSITTLLETLGFPAHWLWDYHHVDFFHVY